MTGDFEVLRAQKSWRYFPAAYRHARPKDVSRAIPPTDAFITLYSAIQAIVSDEVQKREIKRNPLLRLWPFSVRRSVHGPVLELHQSVRYEASTLKPVTMRVPIRIVSQVNAVRDAEDVFKAVVKRLRQYIKADRKLLLLVGARGPNFRASQLQPGVLTTHVERLLQTGVVFWDRVKPRYSNVTNPPAFLTVFVDETRLMKRMKGEADRETAHRLRVHELDIIARFLSETRNALSDRRLTFYEAKEIADAALANSQGWPQHNHSDGWFRSKIWGKWNAGNGNGRRKELPPKEEQQRARLIDTAIAKAASLVRSEKLEVLSALKNPTKNPTN